MYGQQSVVAPVSNPVIYGKFPKYHSVKSSVKILNKILSFVLLLLVVLSFISYYFVANGEKNLNLTGREIVSLTNENIELQNKLDNMNSFNRVDKIIQEKSFLDTAKNVIEVSAPIDVAVPVMQNIPVNYNWSVGY